MTDMRLRPDPERGYPGRSYRFYTPLRPDLAPIFEFGHGLSYSHFEYNDLTVPVTRISSRCYGQEPGRKGWLRQIRARLREVGLNMMRLAAWDGSTDNELEEASRAKRGTDAGLHPLRQKDTKLLRSLASGFEKIFSTFRVTELYRIQEGDGQHVSEAQQRAFEILFTVRNRGSHAGQETVLLFASPPEQAVREEGAAVKSLIAFDKVELAPGEEKRLAFSVDPVADLRIVDRVGERRLWPGNYVFKVGSLQARIHIGA